MRAGENVTVFTTTANGDCELDVPVSVPVDVNGVETWYFPRQRPNGYFYSPAMAEALRQHAGEFDVIHLHGIWCHANLAGRKAALRARVPYVATLHGAVDPIVLRKSWLKKQLYWRLCEAPTLQRVAALIALTDQEKQHIEALGLHRRVVVLPNGLDPAQYADIPSRQALSEIAERLVTQPYVLFLSRIHAKKGLDMLIPAFARVIERFSDWLLVIAGPDDGGYQATVEQQVRQCGLEGRVLFTGPVAGARKLALLGNADVFCLPSYSEGLPTAVVEAMLCGRPVVITRNCYMPEVATCGAGLVVETTVQGIEQGLSEIMGTSQRRQMGEAGQACARESYDSALVAEKTVALYREIIGR